MTTLALLTLLVAAGEVRPPMWSDPAQPRLGDLAIVYIQNDDPAVLRAPVHVFGYQFIAFRVRDDLLRAFVAVPMHIEPGEYPINVVYAGRADQGALTIVTREFDKSELTVGKQFTEKKSAALIARLRQEEREFRAIFGKEPGPPRWNGKMLRPVPGEVTAVFGTRRIFNGRLSSTHYGLDLDGRTGDPIKAVAGGRVVMSAMRWASGGTVIIDHGGGLFTAYYHMSKRYKIPGNIVKAGDTLGLVGKTGRVTGPHLHLAVLVRAVKLDRGRPRGPRSFYVEPATFLEMELVGDAAYAEPPASLVQKKAAKTASTAMGQR